MPRLLPGTITREQNAARWRDLVHQYHDSPLGTLDYCARHGVAVSSFRRWRRQFAVADAAPAASAECRATSREEGFVPVRVLRASPAANPTPRATPTLTLALPNGLRIENIEAGNVTVVAALVAAL